MVAARKVTYSQPMPTRLIHADWGSDSKKRWMCVARLRESECLVDEPVLVGDLATFWDRARDGVESGPIVVGFDFPIGLPSAYATRAGIDSFPEALASFGTGEWQDFYRVCEGAEEIGLRRPFYPFRTGGTKLDHLIHGLGLADRSELLRICECRTADRGPASPLFWTLGGKQVGKAAIIGWRDLLAPALQDPALPLRLWPFDGGLAELLSSESVVVVETYPAEGCIHLGLTAPGTSWSKRSQAGRAAQAGPLIAWAAERVVTFSDSLVEQLCDGFGPSKDAEDPFDALLGLLSMLEVCTGYRREGTPRDPRVHSVEGWILGQKVTRSIQRSLLE